MNLNIAAHVGHNLRLDVTGTQTTKVKQAYLSGKVILADNPETFTPMAEVPTDGHDEMYCQTCDLYVTGWEIGLDSRESQVAAERWRNRP